jgi:hypothetical protein
MAIVSTRMHSTWTGGTVRTIVGFKNRQPVHIRAEANTRTVPNLERSDDPGARQPAVHWNVALSQPGGDKFCGIILLEGGFGMGVQVPPPLDHLIVKFGNSLDHWHRAYLRRTVAVYISLLRANWGDSN